eukprot:jgi/Ulvmu1/5258/UM022_0052.1
MASGDNKLCPFGYQVAGHFTEDHVPTILQTSNGDIVKPLVPDERGARELQFYTYAEHARVGMPPAELAHVDCQYGNVPELDERAQITAASSIVRVADGHAAALQRLKGVVRYIPRCFGIKQLDSGRGVVLENLCKRYTKPFICDIKLGFKTTYAWASEDYNIKNRTKDAASTQGALGFKVSGMCRWKGTDKVHLGKSDCNTASTNMTEFLESFTESDSGKRPADVWGPVMAVLADMSDWARSQVGQAWHLTSVSLLVIYEGAAASSENVRVRCGLVDFAHSFFVAEGPDQNMLQALKSLNRVLACITGTL